jgi:hypothetical protein
MATTIETVRLLKKQTLTRITHVGGSYGCFGGGAGVDGSLNCCDIRRSV